MSLRLPRRAALGSAASARDSRPELAAGRDLHLVDPGGSISPRAGYDVQIQLAVAVGHAVMGLADQEHRPGLADAAQERPRGELGAGRAGTVGVEAAR